MVSWSLLNRGLELAWVNRGESPGSTRGRGGDVSCLGLHDGPCLFLLCRSDMLEHGSLWRRVQSGSSLRLCTSPWQKSSGGFSAVEGG